MPSSGASGSVGEKVQELMGVELMTATVFSAAVAGLRSPEEALKRAQRQVDHLTGADE